MKPRAVTVCNKYLNGDKISWKFYEKQLQKTNQRLELKN